MSEKKEKKGKSPSSRGKDQNNPVSEHILSEKDVGPERGEVETSKEPDRKKIDGKSKKKTNQTGHKENHEEEKKPHELNSNTESVTNGLNEIESNGDNKKQLGKNHTAFNTDIWKLDPYFEQNIAKIDTNKFECKTCKDNSVPERWRLGYFENIETHLQGKTHIKYCGLAEEAMKNLVCIFQRWKRGEIGIEKNKNFSDLKKLIRFEYSLFVINNGMPYDKVEVICDFVHELFKKYSVTEMLKVSISNSTSKQIITNCIAPVLKQNIMNDIAENFFSLGIDESADLYGSGYIGVTVKYIQNEDIVVKQLAVIPNATNKTGETLFQQIENSIFIGQRKREIQEHFLGLCTDGAKNMTGKNAGLAFRLKAKYEHIIITHDYSHVFNLIAESAVAKFPKPLKIIKKISHHFKSVFNKALFREIQIKSGESTTLELISYTETRFLSLYQCTERIIQLWPHLVRYKDENPSFEVDINSESKFYITTLFGLLAKLVEANEYFQSDKHFYPDIFKKLLTVFTIIAKIVAEDPSKNLLELGQQFEYYIKLPCKNKTQLAKYFCSDEMIKANYLDWQFIDDPEYINKISQDSQKQVFQNIKSFVVTAMKRAIKLISFEDPLLKHSDILYLWSFDPQKWKDMTLRFKNVIQGSDLVKLGNELKSFIVDYQNPMMQETIKMNRFQLIKLWKLMGKSYPAMEKLALAIVVLPYSSCSVERLFSRLKITKTPVRNRLSTENLEAILLCKEYFGDNPVTITQEMLDKYDSMWKKINEKGSQDNNIENFDLNDVEFIYNDQRQTGEYQEEGYNNERRSLIRKATDTTLSKSAFGCPDKLTRLNTQPTNSFSSTKVHYFEPNQIQITKTSSKVDEREKNSEQKEDDETMSRGSDSKNPGHI